MLRVLVFRVVQASRFNSIRGSKVARRWPHAVSCRATSHIQQRTPVTLLPDTLSGVASFKAGASDVPYSGNIQLTIREGSSHTSLEAARQLRVGHVLHYWDSVSHIQGIFSSQSGNVPHIPALKRRAISAWGTLYRIWTSMFRIQGIFSSQSENVLHTPALKRRAISAWACCT
jgi:hypothetical protein